MVKLEARRRIRWEGGGGSPKMKNLMKAKRRTARENWPRKKARRAFILPMIESRAAHQAGYEVMYVSMKRLRWYILLVTS
jgi:hypothetical protein